MERAKQKDMILVHLSRYGSITSNEAKDIYAINRLTSRVCELRKMGFPIVKETEHGVNRFGDKVCFARYFLKEVNECRIE